ncbi:phospholipid-translocating P-type ATPase [Yamadazyma tenuis ATCC 10573]|uniref:Phospholipid-transporting ATPase n=2 Tax=Candida tenuis TaxID=2315449 RepID=G3B9Z9_CANTC|nr:phospholipid-translocating P-type ATPase [Yamadazyma tenuis ATCC 10573]EGV61365.1 phospholipid-translocating P-type ATPase [Yamadazyma tenuis ATCC 10573]
MPQYMKEIYFKTPRYVFVNQELPSEMKDAFGKPVLTYARNKIRTTKYTVLSFLPKNLLFQFRNAANSYFLLLVILGIFQIFGVPNPGLAAVPLIVIVCITAIRDAFEDYRRGSSDYDLNNSPIHLLHGVHNTNVLKDDISGWRKFKKANTKVVRSIMKVLKKGAIMTFTNKKTKQEFIRKEQQIYNTDLRRVSTIISDTSIAENGYRASFQSAGRRSHQFSVKPKEIAHSLINPTLIQENYGKDGDFKFKNRCWKDVSVGDFIRVRANEEVPADMVLVSTSDIEGNCFIETKNLDGETNLKVKKCVEAGGANHLKHSNDLANTKFWLECDPPNANLYGFKGTIHYEDYDKEGNLIHPDEKEPVNNDNVMLRGSTLRNTKWVIGLVVYTGEESKIMLNSGITPTKASRISRELNLSVFINFALVFIMCFVSAIVNGIFYNKSDTSRVFYEFQAYGSTAAINGVICFFVVLIVYQSLVPISLYISVEIVKTCQAFFIFSDIKMYYDKLDYPCIPKSWNISDDLGQIEYVFSDKTGTLTQNVMEFKKSTINGVSYGLAYSEAKQGLDRRNGVDIIQQSEMWKNKIAADKAVMVDDLEKFSENDQFREESLTFISSQYVKDTLVPETLDKTQKAANETFMLALALCHTVMTEVNAFDESLRDYKAESPDEAALVAVARDVGITFKERQRNLLTVEVYGEEQKYELLETIQFTSARKRMSCFVRTPEGKILLLCKGADNVIFQRLSKSGNSSNVISKTALHLEEYAKEGLRTLCIAQKEVDSYSFNQWLKRYKEAKASIEDDRDDILEELSEEIENNLVLLGGTAIEDRLQQGVPDSISLLSEAGIKLWVLTGDRIETAINIGFSCNLLTTSMKLLVVKPDDDDSTNADPVDELVSKYLQQDLGITDLSNAGVDQLIKTAINDHSTPTNDLALIIDGAALALVFGNEIDGLTEKQLYLKKKFLYLGKQCKSVICCRVSPAQKAQVVKMVKNDLQVMTLAIGDGANDVAMIQTADVGVGIAGEEGRQAVMSADYAIGQFRFLTRLLLVHGRWSYKRLAEMIPCFFYKNVVFTFTCFWYGVYNNFDGSYYYEYTFLMFYNLAFTSLPIIFLAVFDQDVSDTVSLLVPPLYRSGILRKDWTQTKFTWYMFDGLYQSVIAFFFVILTFRLSFQNPQGLAVDHRFWQGVICCAICVTSCDIYVLLKQYRWDYISLIIYSLSILVVFFWVGVWSATTNSQEFYGAGAQTLGTLSLWCVYFVSVLICLLPRFTYDLLMTNFRPKDIDIIREKVRQGAYDDYPQGYDPTNMEDVERHRLLKELYKIDPDALAKFEQELQSVHSSASSEPKNDHNPFAKTFKSIRRKTTINRSRGNTLAKEMNSSFHKPIDLDKLRKQMINNGELGGGGLTRISTTHELPGLTQAETLISYHTRTSINFDH